MKYHIAAFVAGFILDLIIGDPHWLPHPIRLIGCMIAGLEKRLNRARVNAKDNKENHKIRYGVFLVVLVILATSLVSAAVLFVGYRIHPYLGTVIETVMTYQILATKCLRVESMKVYTSLKEEGLEAGRRAVSMIVGRDTDALDAVGVTKAAVETVAENTSDGVIAPMLYTAIGGPVLGFVYKAINTMDSMIGYKNDRYLCFGRAAAKLDDVVNFLPARISARLMILAAYLGGSQFDGAQARKIYRRDRRKHASPNSAQTEAVCAGALRIQLAGDAVYFGKTVKKPLIGDALRPIEYEDIRRANRLMYRTAWICEVLCSLGLCSCYLYHYFLWGMR